MERTCKMVVVAFLLLLLTAAVAYSQIVAPGLRYKLDASLAGIVEAVSRGQEPDIGLVPLTGEPDNPIVRCLVKIGNRAGLNEIETAGGIIGSVHGDIVTVRIPLAQLGQLAAGRNVGYIEGAYRLYPDLDAALPDADVDIVKGYKIPPQNTRYCDGAGVIAGIVDSGIDFAHADFNTTDDGQHTRVMWLWDQDDTNGSAQTPAQRGFAAGWNYGRLYDTTQMNNGSCPHQDTNGHGTHVAGIAAGDGSGTGNGQPANVYVGCASAADIIAVQTDGYNDSILDGFDFIRTAAGTGPHVINLSMGYNIGPHDGTTLFEQAINSDVSTTNSVIVTSAGNTGASGLHATGTVTTGADLSLLLAFSSRWGRNMPVDIWYQENDRLSIRVRDSYGGWHPGESTWYTSGGGPQSFVLPGPYTCYVTPTVGATINDDNRWLVQISDSSDTGFYGWYLVLHAENALPDGGVAHAWIGSGYYSIWYSPTIPVNSMTVGSPGTAEKAITVAAHNTKLAWTDVNGDPQSYTGTIGDIADFSSRGPTRTGDYRKPEISAPGRYLASTYSQYDSSENKYIAQDGVHVHMQGTSMSSPMVTGVVALMLQKSAWTGGGATPATIKQALLNNTRTDGYTGTCPNDDWGYGKLDADAAWNYLPTAAGVDEFVATRGNGKAYLEWKVSDEIDYVGFDIYRAATIFGGWVKINEAMIQADGDEYRFIDDTIPLAEGHYLYRIETISSNGASQMRGSAMVDFGRRNPDQMEQQLLENLTQI